MKNNTHSLGKFYLIMSVSILFLSLLVSTAVHAERVKVGGEGKLEVNDSGVSATVSEDAKVENAGNVENTGDAQNNIGDDNGQEYAATGTEATSSKEENNNGENQEDRNQGDVHKSRIASVVRELLSVADREDGIGADVRLVAEEQASTSEKVKKSMDEVDSESSLKKFFLGPNFKNLGDLRSTIVTTQNHIERLKKAEDRMASSTVKADLSAQISELEKVASSTEAFVNSNEERFSLFGWFVRLFSR